jgi:hypothetical protein
MTINKPENSDKLNKEWITSWVEKNTNKK